MNKDRLLGVNVFIFTVMQFAANLGLEHPAVIMGWRPEKMAPNVTLTVSKEENASLLCRWTQEGKI